MEYIHLIVTNIPASYRSHHLRTHFTEFTETNKFDCFHFRHRPQENGTANVNTFTCVLRMKIIYESEFMKKYHKRNWSLNESIEPFTPCLISKTDGTFDNLKELNPPAIMPHGNIGTSTQFFLDSIQNCKLPPRLIAKLRLQFPRNLRKRTYASVSHIYESITPRREEKDNYKDGPILESDVGRNDDDGEEWERHEALHNDVSARRVLRGDPSQIPGTKERTFESKVEVTWDKGSSGLVFYTDAFYWKEMEAEAEEADDWDVDMSSYVHENGDKDSKDYKDMRRSYYFRTNKNERDSVFKSLGQFEKHTKGFGSKILRKHGWKKGQGLGTNSESSLKEALIGEGQYNKCGFGFKGQTVLTDKDPVSKVNFFSGRKKKKSSDWYISTIYDDSAETDPKESIDGSISSFYLSHRT